MYLYPAYHNAYLDSALKQEQELLFLIKISFTNLGYFFLRRSSRDTCISVRWSSLSWVIANLASQKSIPKWTSKNNGMIDGAIVQVCSWLLGQGMEMYITTFMDKEVINVVIIYESTVHINEAEG